ncbi:MAG TPA: hypothetical protein P5065_07835 [Candidatus Ratteibacteria bacterium]|jgi:tagatose-1,6-bisphosphate aldolase|uniref:Tagatose 1,6-diphosphate aldolase n=1 Tax=candidate division TA06 bacterium ADurb.Bin131 TaxID=1852827 RepID=A0A1V6C5M9_UNCT6|nr:MAG: tagatose 1,6-diphosphate aldolase [candidate division TA06 bacterium ADurb.Bin131]HON06249.1 hypothetical protein [bacterium]HPC30238.1 hypothetical protein [bacterium]HRS06928.1 hypothetical protein [Candidatus Ratteibacteria bacterium]HRV05043.1 hypothetical protein [Candidatus Ratteibacteria bacterium]
MKNFAQYRDGVGVSEEIFKTLARYSPEGVFDVFASDQHSSYLKLTESYFKHIGLNKKPDDNDVKEVCLRFARRLRGNATAALFNHLAYLSPNFREVLGKDVMLIGRLEDTNTQSVDGGLGQIARFSVKPEDVVSAVDGFKILVKLNPAHKESWEKNIEFASTAFEAAQKLNRPLFTETLLFQLPGESKVDFAKRLPDGVVAMAKDFGPLGHFYKTQIPLLWTEEDGKIIQISSPQVVRDSAMEMEKISPRPMLLLSAAVDFEQYCAQYGIVCDLISGPMCGRAYFKEAFTDPATKDWDTLEESFARIAIPRINVIRKLARAMSLPWWYKFSSMTDEAKSLIKQGTRQILSVRADFGY